MAKARAKAAAAKPSSTADIERYLLLERIRGPVLPGILGGAALLLMVLANAGALSMAPALTVAGALLLLLGLFFGLSGFLDVRVTQATAAAAAGFAIAYGVVTYYPLFTAINWPPALASADVKVKGPGLVVPLANAGGALRIVVEGHLPPMTDRVAHAAHYRLRVSGTAASEQVLEGDLSERWGTQRLGRRGTAPVAIARTEALHEIASATPGDLKITLEELAGEGGDTLTLHVYPAAFPTVAFAVLGVLLTGFAWLLDTWRPDGPSDPILLTSTLSGLLSVAMFRAYLQPHPTFGYLLFSGAVGVVAGYLAAWVLWRVTSSLRSA